MTPAPVFQQLTFDDLYALWRMTRFPVDGSTENLHLLRSDVIDVKLDVDVVGSYVRTGVHRRSAGDPLPLADEIVARADELLVHLSGDDRVAAQEMQACTIVVAALYRAILAEG